MITLTDEAKTAVLEYMTAEGILSEPSAVLRASVLPGGCSGFSYNLTVDDKLEEDDIVLESNGIRIAVDPFSMQYLNGTTIDYQSSMMGAGFTFENPNATGGCGCGSSFSA
jgi:iron-sulfur cluster assembly accessory protein